MSKIYEKFIFLGAPVQGELSRHAVTEGLFNGAPGGAHSVAIGDMSRCGSVTARF